MYRYPTKVGYSMMIIYMMIYNVTIYAHGHSIMMWWCMAI